MNIRNVWQYPEIEKVLSDPRSDQELAAEMPNRTAKAITLVRKYADRYERGYNDKYVSAPIRSGFQRFFLNKGNHKLAEIHLEEQVEKKPEQIQAVAEDTCPEKIHALSNEVETVLEGVKELLTKYAEAVVEHGNHQMSAQNKSLTKEVDSFKKWKESIEPELNQLREFKENAQQSNFSKMLQRVGRRPQVAA